MANSIRGTFTRTNTSTVWSMYVFFVGLTDNINALDATGKVATYMKGNPATDLSLTVDHYVADDAWWASNKDSLYQHIPLWKTSTNQADVDTYHTENNITVTTEEVADPDLTGYVPIRDVPRPEGYV